MTEKFKVKLPGTYLEQAPGLPCAKAIRDYNKNIKKCLVEYLEDTLGEYKLYSDCIQISFADFKEALDFKRSVIDFLKVRI